MSSFLRILLFALILAPLHGGGTGHGDPGLELGLPYIHNFGPRQYRADAQNWAVVQDRRGLVYAANNTGVLEFDGVRWRVIPTAKSGVVRSLALGPDGRIYVGAVGEFGVLAPDRTGQLGFVTLSGGLKLCPDFTDVFTTAATPRGILFQSREALFLLEAGRVREWKAATTFHTAFVVQGRIFARQREVGLQELQGDSLVMVPGGERFKGESIFAMVDLDGAGGPGGILVGSRNLGLLRMSPAGMQPFAPEAAAYIKNNALYQGARLPDGSIALATLRGGVLLLGADGRPRGGLDHTKGLLGDNVKQVLPGQGPSLWMALDTGLAQVEWPSPFTVFDERLGIHGQVWDMARHRGSLYAATGQGVYRLQPGTGLLPQARFVPLDGLASQCCSLLALPDQLLVASGQGVFAIQGDRVQPVRPSSASAIALVQSRLNPERIFAGLQGRLVSLRRSPGGRGWIDEGAVTGIEEDIYSVVEEADGSLWLGTGGDHVLRVRFPFGWNGGPDPRTQVERFGAKDGLAGSSFPTVARVRGALVVGTRAGVFAFKEHGARFEPHPMFKDLFPAGPRWIRSIREDAQGRVWMAVTDEVHNLEATGCAVLAGPAMVWQASPFQRLGDNLCQAVFPEDEGLVWFGGPGGIQRFDPAMVAAEGSRPFQAQVRRLIEARELSVLGGDREGQAPPSIPYRNGGLRFEFSAPAPGPEGGVRFQVRLDGFSRDWSPWSTEAQKEYSGLAEGRYVFRVRAQDAQGHLSSQGTFAFDVRTPWHRTWWARLSYLTLAGLGLWGILQARTRLLRQRNVMLHARITEATWELKVNERRLAVQAADLERMNQELRGLNQQKNEFLGIVVHDLRNPLTGILLAGQLILDADEPEEIRRRARQVLNAGADMNTLIARFLDLATIDGGGVQPDTEPIDVTELLVNAEFRFSEGARSKDIRIELAMPDQELMALGDRRFLKEALDNLLSNALKFSPSATRVLLRAESSGAWVRISVEDQGPGLTGEDQERLFNRFARLSAQPTGGEASLGLGLSIVKHLVEAMHGRIWAESEPGRGAAFRVELPVP